MTKSRRESTSPVSRYTFSVFRADESVVGMIIQTGRGDGCTVGVEPASLRYSCHSEQREESIIDSRFFTAFRMTQCRARTLLVNNAGYRRGSSFFLPASLSDRASARIESDIAAILSGGACRVEYLNSTKSEVIVSSVAEIGSN